MDGLWCFFKKVRRGFSALYGLRRHSPPLNGGCGVNKPACSPAITPSCIRTSWWEDETQVSAQAHKLEREIDNLIAFIRGGDSIARVREDLARSEEHLQLIKGEALRLEKTPSDAILIPPVSEIKAMARTALSGLAKDSSDVGKLMKLIIPKIVVFPVRLCVGGMIVLRARFRLRVSNLLSDQRVRQALQQPLERVLTVDLFDPPQPEAFRRRICELRAGGMTQREAADQCGLTVTAAQNAAGLQRRMDALGLTDPYVAVTKPPDDYHKLRWHLHSRYRFEPLEIPASSEPTQLPICQPSTSNRAGLFLR